MKWGRRGWELAGGKRIKRGPTLGEEEIRCCGADGPVTGGKNIQGLLLEYPQDVPRVNYVGQRQTRTTNKGAECWPLRAGVKEGAKLGYKWGKS